MDVLADRANPAMRGQHRLSPQDLKPRAVDRAFEAFFLLFPGERAVTGVPAKTGRPRDTSRVSMYSTMQGTLNSATEWGRRPRRRRISAELRCAAVRPYRFSLGNFHTKEHVLRYYDPEKHGQNESNRRDFERCQAVVDRGTGVPS